MRRQAGKVLVFSMDVIIIYADIFITIYISMNRIISKFLNFWDYISGELPRNILFLQLFQSIIANEDRQDLQKTGLS